MTDASLVCPQCGLTLQLVLAPVGHVCIDHGQVDPVYPLPEPLDLNVPSSPAA